ncbi:translation initiation factor IF-2 N-terminal domain-containing protein, partial [Thermodesulfobacteriota bacterium]
MAKVRVYELAKELNIGSKELVEKLKSGGMVVKNYMSTLDEGEIKRARDIFNGTVSEVIEEKRIRKNVIRRRKKVVKVEEEKPEVKVDEKEAADQLSPETEAEIEEKGDLEETSEVSPDKDADKGAVPKKTVKAKKKKGKADQEESVETKGKAEPDKT